PRRGVQLAQLNQQLIMYITELLARPLRRLLVAILHQQVTPVTGDGPLIKLKFVASVTSCPRASAELVDVQGNLRREHDHIIGDGDHRLCYPSRSELGAQIKQDL